MGSDISVKFSEFLPMGSMISSEEEEERKKKEEEEAAEEEFFRLQ